MASPLAASRLVCIFARSFFPTSSSLSSLEMRVCASSWSFLRLPAISASRASSFARAASTSRFASRITRVSASSLSRAIDRLRSPCVSSFSRRSIEAARDSTSVSRLRMEASFASTAASRLRSCCVVDSASFAVDLNFWRAAISLRASSSSAPACLRRWDASRSAAAFAASRSLNRASSWPRFAP